MRPADLGYVAALLDNLAVLKTRRAHETDLPTITLNGSYRVMNWLTEVTGNRLIRVRRDYNKHLCQEHCPTAHEHVESGFTRWEVVGVKATIVLYNVLPYLRVQRDRADELIELGKTIGYKGNAVAQMRELGWKIPPLKDQPRARIKEGP